jgi:hypothetical protein
VQGRKTKEYYPQIYRIIRIMKCRNTGIVEYWNNETTGKTEFRKGSKQSRLTGQSWLFKSADNRTFRRSEGERFRR